MCAWLGGRYERGFTLIELLMVIVVISILSYAAVTQMYFLRSGARETAEAGVIAAARGGIAAAHAESLISGAIDLWPVSLDTSTTDDVVFEAVLEQGIPEADGWSFDGTSTYTGPTRAQYTYDSNTGILE